MNNARQIPFNSFFQGGFECSSHRRYDRKRLDMIGASQHDRFIRKDYQTLQAFGIRTVRDGIRWHLIEQKPRAYDFASVLPMLRAAQITSTQVIWDLFHYGWPDDIDIFSSQFVKRLGSLARAFTKLLREESDNEALICPVNEPSFLSWLGGDKGFINPYQKGRGFELKAQLIRAAIEAIYQVRDVLPEAYIFMCEPAIHIVADPERPQDREEAEHYRLFQFQSMDMLTGRLCPELGGREGLFDILGLNYYWNNQWRHNGKPIVLPQPEKPRRTDSLYRPFRDIIKEYYDRYGIPIFISETGNEDHRRARWLEHVASEVFAAREGGLPVLGICLYPIVNHPGWDNDRHCYCGLFDYPPDEEGNREVYEPLLEVLMRWRDRFESAEEERSFATPTCS